MTNKTKTKNKLQTDYDKCIKYLKENDVVCEGCGGKLEPIETEDNSGTPTYWIGCIHCGRFRSGIEKEYWEIARYLVENDKLIVYSFISKDEYQDTPENLEYYFDLQTAGLSHIIKEIHEMLKEKFNKNEKEIMKYGNIN